MRRSQVKGMDGRVGMPCYRCQARQTDPVRGESPWGRGVVGGEQVLVCPTCQRDGDWRLALDSCRACGSTHLAKALGLVVCRDCGARTDPAGTPPWQPGSARQPTAGPPAPALPPGAIPTPASEPVPGAARPRVPAPTAGGDEQARAAGPDLAADVEAALARIFGRSDARPGYGGGPEPSADQ